MTPLLQSVYQCVRHHQQVGVQTDIATSEVELQTAETFCETCGENPLLIKDGVCADCARKAKGRDVEMQTWCAPTRSVELQATAEVNDAESQVEIVKVDAQAQVEIVPATADTGRAERRSTAPAMAQRRLGNDVETP